MMDAVCEKSMYLENSFYLWTHSEYSWYLCHTPFFLGNIIGLRLFLIHLLGPTAPSPIFFSPLVGFDSSHPTPQVWKGDLCPHICESRLLHRSLSSAGKLVSLDVSCTWCVIAVCLEANVALDTGLLTMTFTRPRKTHTIPHFLKLIEKEQYTSLEGEFCNPSPRALESLF